MNTYEIIYEQNGKEYSDFWNANTIEDAVNESNEWFSERNCKVLEVMEVR